MNDKQIDDETRQLRREIEHWKARAELEEVKRTKGRPPAKSFRRKVMEWFLGGGALLALGGQALDFTQQGSKNDIEISKTVCDNAHRAVQDDQYSKGLTEAQSKEYSTRQLEITKKCDKKIE